MYSSGTLAVRCTHCRSVLAAPRGHSTIACGHCGAELHIGATSGTVRTSAELRAEMARAAEEARSAAQASNAAAESSLASCEVFEADASFAAQRLECPITTEAMKEGDRVMKLPCGHMFLEESIRMWLGTSNTCPLCRAELPTRSGAARVDPERAAYDAARRVAQDHGGAPGGGAAGHGGAGSSYHSTGLRVAALPRGGGYGPGVTQRSSAQYPMARGAPQGGGWRPAPSYPPRHDGEGCCVM